MNTEALEGIGLSQTEIKVFLTLLELGETKANNIIKKSSLQSSSVYNAVNSLISKGFISYIKKSQIKYYRAADPEAILDYIELKKGEYLKLLPQLKEKQNKTNNEGVEFYKSFKGIKTLISQLLKDSKKGDIYRSFSVDDFGQFQTSGNKVFKLIKQLFIEKKIITKGIFHENTRRKPTKDSIMEKRYLNIPLLPNTLIFQDRVAIISWKDEPSGILIHSKDIADNYAEFFDHMWKIAKK